MMCVHCSTLCITWRLTSVGRLSSGADASLSDIPEPDNHFSLIFRPLESLNNVARLSRYSLLCSVAALIHFAFAPSMDAVRFPISRFTAAIVDDFMESTAAPAFLVAEDAASIACCPNALSLERSRVTVASRNKFLNSLTSAAGIVFSIS